MPTAERPKKALGPEHPDVATSLNNLAALYEAQSHYAESASTFRARLRRRAAVGPYFHRPLPHSIGNFLAIS